ncbi:hypothetical protein EAH84_01520 [Sphingomonas oligophenolica]|uniref:Autotransporter outer membrane beta-barrel domain-containing protein n=1 Tax=Sphingomonas oligophenolica TaxID=301154 RepID=A0A502CRJ0_9SPHN|nr:hypothetical protein EAH84_01520 [Sphingomonas oligophenolica]
MSLFDGLLTPVYQDESYVYKQCRSFVLRAGAETRLLDRVGARIEFEHLDDSRDQFMLGISVRL